MVGDTPTIAYRKSMYKQVILKITVIGEGNTFCNLKMNLQHGDLLSKITRRNTAVATLSESRYFLISIITWQLIELFSGEFGAVCSSYYSEFVGPTRL